MSSPLAQPTGVNAPAASAAQAEQELEALRARVAELEGRLRDSSSELAREVERQAGALQRMEARLGRLHRATVALSEAPQPQEVARVLLEGGREAGLGACAGTVLLLTADGHLEVAASFGEEEVLLGPTRRLPLDSALPPARVARSSQALWLGTPEALEEAWPYLSSVRQALGIRACSLLPLGESRTQGVLGLSFPTPHSFPPEERLFLQALANQAGHALERTRLSAAERALRAETERTARTLDAFVTHAPAAFSLSDLQGRLLLTNPMFERLGLDVGEGNQRAAAEGRAVEVEGEVATGLGTRTLHSVHFPVWEASGALVATGTITTDLTERRRAQEAFRFLADTGAVLSSSLVDAALLERLALLAVPRFGDWCAVHLKDARGGPVQLLACRHRDPLKEGLLRVLLERRLPVPGVADAVGEVLSTGRPVLALAWLGEELETRVEDPEVRDLLRALGLGSAMVVPLQVQGRVLGALSFGTGLSRRPYDSADLAVGEELGGRVAVAIDNAHLFAVVQTERARAESASRHKDEFLAMVSHELRTPLTAILGWTQLLRARTIAPERQAHALGIIERNARSQAQLIEDLLDVSRITTGKVRLEMGEVALGSVVEAALEAVRPAAEAKGLALEASLEPGVPLVTGDAVRLQQVVWNLLSNAVKFTPAGHVRVRLGPDAEQGGAVLAVEDTGEGIAPDFLPHVFGRFRQADTSSKRVHGGLGLGLSIVRALVEQHGGTVRAESEGRGRGARFTVWLPPRVVEPASQPVQAAPAPPRRLEGVRVLVVDDQPEVVEFVVELLTAEGAQAVGVDSAAAALERLAQGLHDVLVADLSMPGEDGLSLVRRLRELPPERGGMVPALALTAYAREVDSEAALEAGFTAHMPKPVEAAALIEMVTLLARVSPTAARAQ